MEEVYKADDTYSQVMRKLDQDNRLILCILYFKVVEQIHKMDVQKDNYIVVARRTAAHLFTTHAYIDTKIIQEAIKST